MKKFWSLLLVIVMIAAMSACGGYGGNDTSSNSGSSTPPASTSDPAPSTTPDASADAIHLKLSHPSAEGGPYDLMSKKFAELVAEKSGGKYAIDIFAANALGTQEEVLDAVSLGTLDLAVTSDDILAKYAPEWGYIGLPFLFDDVDDVDENLNGELGAYLSSKLEDKGMFIISFFENGFRNVTANKEINLPEDLSGLKIRVMTNEPLRAMFTNAGAVVTNVSFSELYQALQLGTCEAQENPFANIRDKKFNEVQQYLCVTMHSHTAEPLVMSKDLFDGLSAEDQEMFKAAGLEASKWAYQYAKDTDAENRAYLESVMTVTDPDRAAWKEFAEQTNASYMEQYSEVSQLKK